MAVVRSTTNSSLNGGSTATGTGSDRKRWPQQSAWSEYCRRVRPAVAEGASSSPTPASMWARKARPPCRQGRSETKVAHVPCRPTSHTFPSLPGTERGGFAADYQAATTRYDVAPRLRRQPLQHSQACENLWAVLNSVGEKMNRSESAVPTMGEVPPQVRPAERMVGHHSRERSTRRRRCWTLASRSAARRQYPPPEVRQMGLSHHQLVTAATAVDRAAV